MKKYTLCLLVGLALPGVAHAKTYKEMFGDIPPSTDSQTRFTVSTLHFKQDELLINNAHAKLTATSDFYYLQGLDAQKVLQLWGNPSDTVKNVQGMILPAGIPPEKAPWGAAITYSDEGHVTDDDAASTDYKDLLKQLQDAILTENPEREKRGYDRITLMGWASPPTYDKNTHTLHWARDLIFGSNFAAPHTLNYELRSLGREGVLEVNFIAGMDQLADIKKVIPSVSSVVSFQPGEGYADFRDGDKLAGYGLAGLIATAAGVKIAGKLGFLAVMIPFLKKGFILILIAGAALLRGMKSLFSRKS